MRMRLRVALTVKSRAPPLPVAMAWGTYPLNLVAKIVFPWWRPWMRCFFPSFQDCYNCASLLPRWDGDIYARHNARHSYWDWIGTGGGGGGGGSPETCRTDISHSHISLQILPSFPHIFPHTLLPLPILSLSVCSSSPHHLQLRWGRRRNAQVPIWLWKLSGKKAFTSFSSSWTGFAPSPFLHSKHNFWNIFTRISRQCNVKSSFVELLKCKFKSPFLFNIGIWFDQWLMGSCRQV